MLTFKSETTEDGVAERYFTLEVAGQTVPGLLWTPAKAEGPRPVILIGHGGSLNKEVGRLRGKRYAQAMGYATAAIDAPGHGDRVTPEQAKAFREEIGRRIAAGLGLDDKMRAQGRERTQQAVPEWKATLDGLQALPEIGKGPVGYWGVSMGTAIGVPFVAAEPRVTAAVFGLGGLRDDPAFEAAARAIAIPIEFVFQWDDEVVPRDTGLALFDAFGAKEKTMHINPGRHVQIPPFEAASWERFFARHLGAAADAKAAA